MLRATALGVLSSCGRVGSIAAQFVNGGLQSDVPLLLFVTSATMLTGAIAACMIPNESAKTALN
jgi:hypothetical protein